MGGTPNSICGLIGAFPNNKTIGPLGAVIQLIINIVSALIIMAAVVSIVVGGYIYMTAGGSADRVRLAKVWIGTALLGIVIALSAYMILFAISTNLV